MTHRPADRPLATRARLARPLNALCRLRWPKSAVWAPAMLALAAPAGAQQAGYASLAAIDNAVADFTGKGIGLPGGALLPVDRRLRLRSCATPLMLNWRSTRHEMVVVECPDPGSWHIFVPVRLAEPSAVAIARGESVTVSVVGDGFTVSQPAEAMDSGALGDWIRVRGLKDGSPRGEAIRAKIVRPGEVEVSLP